MTLFFARPSFTDWQSKWSDWEFYKLNYNLLLLSALKQIYSKQNSLQFLKYVCEQNSSTLWLVHEKTLFLNYDCFSDYSLMHNGWNFLKNIKYTSQVVHFMNGCIKAIFIYLQCYVRYIDTELHKWIRRKFLSQTCFVKNHWIERNNKNK